MIFTIEKITPEVKAAIKRAKKKHGKIYKCLKCKTWMDSARYGFLWYNADVISSNNKKEQSTFLERID